MQSQHKFDLGCVYARECFQICLSHIKRNPHATPADLSSSWSLPSSVCALDPPSAVHSANLLGQNLILVRVREAHSFGGEPGGSFHRKALVLQRQSLLLGVSLFAFLAL